MIPPGAALAFAATESGGGERPPTESSDDGDDATPKEPLALPQAAEGSDLKSVQMGEKFSFEGLGPIVIMEDGTTRYISNWDKMNDREKALAWKRIGPRNEERRKKLLAEMAAQQEAEEKAKNEES